MKNHILLGALLFCGGTFVSTTPMVRAQSIQAASESSLAGIELPVGTLRIPNDKLPDNVSGILDAVVLKGYKRGQTEVLGWLGQDYKPSQAEQYKARLKATLENAGWHYKESGVVEGTQGATLAYAQCDTPSPHRLIGIWTPGNSALLLAWTELLPDGTDAEAHETSGAPTEGHTSEEATERSTEAIAIEVPGGNGRHIINVSKGRQQPRVAFAPLAPQAGFARGYVKDAHGKPLVGAVIGVRSTAMGGFYTGASGKTDAKGYYEFAVPGGAASFYNAGYSLDFYDGRAALGLVPADGEASSFAGTEGVVENWILPLYGTADPDEVADQPQFFGNYYGGSFSLGYFVSDNLPVGSEVEVSLTPVGPLLDGSQGKSYLFKQPVEDALVPGFTAVNIPVGQYKVAAQLRQGGHTRPLKIEESGPYANRPFGLEPKKATGSAVLTFRPASAKADSVVAGKSNWDSLALSLYP